jgi:hypothetical protein
MPADRLGEMGQIGENIPRGEALCCPQPEAEGRGEDLCIPKGRFSPQLILSVYIRERRSYFLFKYYGDDGDISRRLSFCSSESSLGPIYRESSPFSPTSKLSRR